MREAETSVAHAEELSMRSPLASAGAVVMLAFPHKAMALGTIRLVDTTTVFHQCGVKALGKRAGIARLRLARPPCEPPEDRPGQQQNQRA